MPPFPWRGMARSLDVAQVMTSIKKLELKLEVHKGFPQFGGYLFWGVLIIWILLFRVLYQGPL